MASKRQMDEAESSNSKRIQSDPPSSIMNYVKYHHTHQTFEIREFLRLLSCNTRETAKLEAQNQLNSILEVKKVNDKVKAFVSSLLADGLKFLSDPQAELYWMEKSNAFETVANAHRQYKVYNTVSSSVLTQGLKELRNDGPIHAATTPPRASPPLASPPQNDYAFENIWSIWSDFLTMMLTEDHDDQDIHEFSLEYLNIITLGNHVGNKQTRHMYPKELVSETNKMMQLSAVDVFRKFQAFYSPLFDALSTSTDECHTLLLRNALKVKNSSDAALQFGFDCFTIFTTQVLKHSDVLSRQESIYNYRVIFPMFDAVVSCIPACTFFPGETRLKAITKELNRQGLSQNNYYNADGVVFDTDSGLELCLLETSGPFGLVDASRETTDQIKAAYGLLSMLHTIAYEFVHANSQLLYQLKICFIHAHQNQIRLWSFGLVGEQLYVLSRVDSATVPTSYCSTFKNDFMRLSNIFWRIKMLTDNAVTSLNELKESHARNQAAYRNGEIDTLPRLDDLLTEGADVKLHSRVRDVSDILISSSPILPGSP